MIKKIQIDDEEMCGFRMKANTNIYFMYDQLPELRAVKRT